MKKIIIPILVIVLAVGAGMYYRHAVDNSKKALVFYGNVENRTQQLSFPFLGTLQSLQKDEGQHFAKGELLATLDPSPYVYELNDVNARIQAQKDILKKLHSGYQKEQIAEAKAALAEAQASLTGIQDTFERKQQLYKQKMLAQQEYISIKAAYNKAKASVHKALHRYTLLKNGYRKEDINAQNAQLMALKAKRASLLYDLYRTKLYAPQKGVVLRRYEETGSVVAPAQSVFEIALQNQYWVRAYIDEPLLGKIKRGEKMLVFTDVRKKPYSGYVAFISAVAEFTPKNVETTELRTDLVYRFRVIVTDPDSMLKQGMPVTIKPKNG
jgi:HlyD family secretion protein